MTVGRGHECGLRAERARRLFDLREAYVDGTIVLYRRMGISGLKFQGWRIRSVNIGSGGPESR
jgi:hypothetical protein